MILPPGRSPVTTRRFGALERIQVLSRSWIFALLSAVVAIGALASCDSGPPIARAARE